MTTPHSIPQEYILHLLDSPIWLETQSTRLAWITLLAMMDTEGTVPIESIANLAHRARISVPEAEAALHFLTLHGMVTQGLTWWKVVRKTHPEL